MVSYGKQEIYSLLSEKGVWHEITEHKAVYNMDEVADIDLPYPEAECKNLFVRDKKKREHYYEKQRKTHVDNNGCGNGFPIWRPETGGQDNKPLGFASEEDLMNILGLIPGAVTPLGLLNDTDGKVILYLDQDFFNGEHLIGVHPNDNTATVWMRADDLTDIIRTYGNNVVITDLADLYE